jgi:hypothetical protein
VLFSLFVLKKLLQLLFLELFLAELKFHVLLNAGVIMEPVCVCHGTVIKVIKVDIFGLVVSDFGKQGGLS